MSEPDGLYGLNARVEALERQLREVEQAVIAQAAVQVAETNVLRALVGASDAPSPAPRGES